MDCMPPLSAASSSFLFKDVKNDVLDRTKIETACKFKRADSFILCPDLSLNKTQLPFMGNRENTDNDPGIWRKPMKLQKRAEKEMKVALTEIFHILRFHHGES